MLKCIRRSRYEKNIVIMVIFQNFSKCMFFFLVSKRLQFKLQPTTYTVCRIINVPFFFPPLYVLARVKFAQTQIYKRDNLRHSIRPVLNLQADYEGKREKIKRGRTFPVYSLFLYMILVII